MAFLGLMMLLCAAVLIVIAVAFISSLKGRKGISKDRAEQLVLRRFAHARIIGARFTKLNGRLVWEFEFRYKSEIHRIAVDAQTAAFIKTADSRSPHAYPAAGTPPLGQRIGP